jgi:hypothetical protein
VIWHRAAPAPVHRQPDTADDAMKRHKDSEPSRAPGTGPTDYVIVVAASDWVKEHFPAAGASLWDALHTGKDRHRDPEPDLEAEP